MKLKAGAEKLVSLLSRPARARGLKLKMAKKRALVDGRAPRGRVD